MSIVCNDGHNINETMATETISMETMAMEKISIETMAMETKTCQQSAIFANNDNEKKGRKKSIEN